MIREQEIKTITEAFELLGPGRVERALQNHIPGSGWSRCFLAAALDDGDLGLDTVYRKERLHSRACDTIRPDRVRTIVHEYDCDYPSRERLLRLAAEWLEANRASAPGEEKPCATASVTIKQELVAEV